MDNRLKHFLEDIAELARSYDGPSAPTYLSLGVSDAITNELSDMGGTEHTSVFLEDRKKPYAIDCVSLRCGQIKIDCQCDPRPATSDEVQAEEARQATLVVASG